MIERLLDSVILIDHLNGIVEATEYIRYLDPGKTAISVITRAEILVGIDAENEDIVKALLNQYHIYSIDLETADMAASLRKVHRWKLPDAFQAAVCQLNQIRLSTRNVKDFDPGKHEFVEVPYTIHRS